jgi:hypothetical protein
VALVQDRDPLEALAIASPWIPRGWSVRAVVATNGAVLLAGPAVRVQGHRAVLGTAVGDPWGLPGEPLDPAMLLRRFARHGDQAMQLAAGPFALVDFERGRVAAAMNGIVPLFVARGTHAAAGNHREVVAALAGAGQVRSVPPGSVAGIDGSTANVTDVPVHESLAQIRLAAIDDEVEVHINRAGRPGRLRSSALAQVASGLRVRRLGDSLVAAPELAALAHVPAPDVALADLRARIGRLWWEAGLRGTHVFVPAFERPGLDTLALAGVTC